MREIFKGTFGEVYPLQRTISMGSPRQWHELAWVQDEVITIVEMEPQRRMFRWTYDGEEIYSFDCPFPYVQFVHFYGRLAVSASSQPFILGDLFHHGPFPNVYFSGKVCQDFRVDIDEALMLFYNSLFDPPYRWPYASPFCKRAFPHFKEDPTIHLDKPYCREWEKLSIDDILRVSWAGMPILAHGSMHRGDFRSSQLENLWKFFTVVAKDQNE